MRPSRRNRRGPEPLSTLKDQEHVRHEQQHVDGALKHIGAAAGEGDDAQQQSQHEQHEARVLQTEMDRDSEQVSTQAGNRQICDEGAACREGDRYPWRDLFEIR